MAYTKTDWHTGAPITLALMNNIENGIEEALAKAANALATANSATTTNENHANAIGENVQAITNINKQIGSGFDENTTIASKITGLEHSIENLNTRIDQNVGLGEKAFSQVVGAGAVYDGETVSKSLRTALDERYASLSEVYTAAITPSGSDTVVINGETKDVITLPRRIKHIYNALDTINTTIDHVTTDGDDTPNGLTLRIKANETAIARLQDDTDGTSDISTKVRLDRLDGGYITTMDDLPSRNIKSIITEIADAHSSDIYPDNNGNATNYGTLELRFRSDERKIKAIETEIGDAHRTGLRDANDEPIADTLDHRFDDIDGGNKPSRTLPSVISEVETARDGAASLHARLSAIDNTQDANSVIKRVETLEQTMPNKVNTSDIYSGLNIQEGVTGKVLDAQYGRVLNEKIGGSFTSENTVASHIGNLETEIGNARPYTEDEQTGEITYGTLDDRFDTVEGRATQLETDVSAIETEINNAHVNNGTLDDRFDAIESAATRLSADVTAIEGEIGDAHRDENDTLDTRFDDIESDITDLSNVIDHVHGENDELPNGLTLRIAAVENSLTELGGINDRLDAIDNASTGAIKELQNTDTGFEQRIHNLELNPSSATVVVSSLPEQGDASKDYLLGPNESGQYFYYKWIVDDAEDNWKLISGGSSGEGGNTSGYVLTLEAYNELEEKSLNTDYYVIDDENIHHYRWIPSDIPGENTQIEITQIIDTNNIKRYLIAKHDRNNISGEPATYLDFYEFAYGANPEVNDEDHALNRIAAIELPKGGGSGTVSSDTVCSVSYVSPLNQLLTQETVENEGVKISFFYLAYTKLVEDNETFYLSQPCTYTLKKGSRVIESGNLKARDVVKDISGNPITPTEEYKRLNATIIDVTKYCKVNEDNDFTLTVTTTGVTPRVRPFHIEVVELGLKSTFSDQTIFNANTNLRIPLTISSPERTKTIYVELNEGTEDEYEITQIHSEKASSNTTITIPAERLTPGLHSVRIYFEEVISGESPASSNELLFDIACRDVNNDTTILLASPYRGKIKELDQYETFKIPYYLYIPDGMSTNIVKINGATNKTTIEAGHTGAGEFLFKAMLSSTIENDEMIPFTLTIGCQEENSLNIDPSFTVQVKVIANEYNIEPVLDNLVFDFNPTGYINNPLNEEDKYWRDENNTSIRLSEVEGENFDWDNGGWKYDDEIEAPYFCIKAGSRAQINYSLFQDNMEAAGSEFKCIFKAVNVRDPEAVFLTSLDNQTSTTTNYSPEKMASDLIADEGEENTLFSSYFNVKEGRVLTYKKGKVSETKVALSIIDGTTIKYSLDDEENAEWESDPENELDTSYIMTNSRFENALNKAKNKVIKKNTTDYATKIMGYVQAYDGAEAAALATLITLERLLDKTTALEISDTLTNDAEWANFRETTTYNDKIMVELPTLIKNLALTYDTLIIVTNNFVKMTVTDDHDDEYEQKLVKNIRAEKANGEIIETQIEISYELDDNENKIYNEIYLIREILGRTQRSRGLEMRAHRANIYLGSGTLTYPYSEEDIIEFEYNISNPIAKKKTAPILMYEDGVPSASMLYSTNSNALVLTDKGNLIIGSDDCDIQIYRMKFYNKKLDNIEILSNFYADALSPDDMVERYETNVATYTDSSDPDSITPLSIAASCPGLRVIMIEAPNLTGGKNSFIKNSKIRCIYKGEDARPEDNWVALNAYHAGQGTSSDAYGAAGRNLDIIFGFNGVDQLIAPKAKNNYRFDPNYKSILITGIDDTDNAIGTADSYIDEILNNLNDGKLEEDEDYITREELLSNDDFTDTHLHMYLNGTGKVNFNDQAVPNNWFNIKLNIASSENTNNALLQKRYDRYLKQIYLTPAQKRDGRIKNDMEFFNCVVFIREVGDPTEFTEDSAISVANRQWHFYGIGNIGDSKKTDDTRINIPNDPFEFCVEVSDNGLTNSGFSSGVYWTDSTKTEITYNATGSYEIKYPVSLEEWENEANETRNALIDYDEDGGWDSSLEFRYDVSTKDGNTIADSEAEKALATARLKHNKEVFKNMYEWVVTADEKGSNSFANHLRDWFIEDSPLYWYVFTERYTMIDSRAKNTFYHFGKVYVSAEEIDGETVAECTRVQACQAALTEALAGEDPIEIATALTAYDTAVYVWEHKDCFTLEGDFPGSYVGAAQINNGYRFDMWDYDNDTALGINNNGQMVFDAGLEDIDRTANAWVYNEATNVFWRRIRNEMQSKLRAIYTSRKAECFNAENLIKEFDEWQAQFPENLWRMDFERKYYRPYLEGNNMRYLRDMANGRKKYQRRLFERNMCIYINSKYVLSDSYDPDDFILFRPTELQHANQDKLVQITLYSPMYVNYSIGNQSEGTLTQVHERGLAGQTLSFNMMEGIISLLNILTKIFNASCIKAIVGLENYYADDLDFTHAKKLRKITLGSNVAKLIDPITGEESTIPYRNNNTKTLELRGNPILEELDIRNCIALAPELDLTECVSLGKLYATGTPLTKVNFAAGGLIKELYLPATIASLEFNNLYLLDTVLLAGYNNIISYISNNIFKYNSKTLVYNILSNLTELKLNDINWVIGNIDELEQFKQKLLELGNKMSISGNIKITGDYSDIELQDYDNFWNHKIIFDVSQGNKETRWKITYKYDDYFNEDTNLTITGETIKTVYVADGAQVPDIWEYWDEEKQLIVNMLTVEDGWTEPPHRDSTRSTIYTFGTYTDNHYNEYSGWKREDANAPLNEAIYAGGHLTLYTYFKTANRTYTINWYLKLLEENGITRPVDLIKSSSNVRYGQGYDQIAPSVKDIHDLYSRSQIVNSTMNVTIEDGIASYEIFDGWQRLPTNINPDGSSDNFNIFAKWKTGLIVLSGNAFDDIHNLSPEKLAILSNLSAADRSRYAPNFVTSQTISYLMGHDYDETITPIMNTQRGLNTTIWRFDRNDNPMTINSIAPFNAENTANGWTLALDYSFVPDVDYNNYDTSFYPNAAVLAGCYDVINENTIVGFALYENKASDFGPVGPCLGFGDMFNLAGQVVSLGSSSSIGERNIVIIRKPKNSSSLFIYSGKNGNASLTATINFEEKVWNKIISENAKLELGRLSHPTLGSLITRAKGTIYWAKFWPEDLGVGECLELAAWPHETITFGIAANNTNATSRNRLTPENTAITLTAISSSNYGIVPLSAAGKSFGDITGWKTSVARTICNDRIFPGLPTTLQSIICKSKVLTKNLEVLKDGGGSNINKLTNVETVRDYIYLPSVANYISTTDYQSESSLFPWAASTAGVSVYTYNVSGSNFTQDLSSAVYKNLRFPGQQISLSSLRILNINGSVGNFKDVFNSESSPFGSVVAGDIIIDDAKAAYMYVSSNDILSKGLQVEPDAGNFATEGNGGWLKAKEHWTRSINFNANNNYYIYIDNASGTVRYTNPNSKGLSLNYSFSV